MSFSDAEVECRERLTESLGLLNYLRISSPDDLSPLDDIQKASRGLWLVSLYAALERSVNAIVDAGIREISSHGTEHGRCVPPIHSILQFSYIQSVKDCKYEKALDQAVRLFESSMGTEVVFLADNPLSNYLKNVDGSTISWICSLFGTDPYIFSASTVGKLKNLRERRNAVAHGRESASQVGQRFNIEDLAALYSLVDEEVVRFRLHLADYCSNRKYIRAA